MSKTILAKDCKAKLLHIGQLKLILQLLLMQFTTVTCMHMYNTKQILKRGQCSPCALRLVLLDERRIRLLLMLLLLWWSSRWQLCLLSPAYSLSDKTSQLHFSYKKGNLFVTLLELSVYNTIIALSTRKYVGSHNDSDHLKLYGYNM